MLNVINSFYLHKSYLVFHKIHLTKKSLPSSKDTNSFITIFLALWKFWVKKNTLKKNVCIKQLRFYRVKKVPEFLNQNQGCRLNGRVFPWFARCSLFTRSVKDFWFFLNQSQCVFFGPKNLTGFQDLWKLRIGNGKCSFLYKLKQYPDISWTARTKLPVKNEVSKSGKEVRDILVVTNLMKQLFYSTNFKCGHIVCD